MPSLGASFAVRDLRGHEGISEGTFELRSDLEHVDPGSGLNSDWVARPEVRAGRVRAHDFLVGQDGSFDGGAIRQAAVRRDRFHFDHAGALLVQEADMGHVSDPPDAIAVADFLVQTCAADLARRTFGLGPAVDEFVARLGLPLADERDLDHNKDPAEPMSRGGLRVTVLAVLRPIH
jgi:hypothetical protein